MWPTNGCNRARGNLLRVKATVHSYTVSKFTLHNGSEDKVRHAILPKLYRRVFVSRTFARRELHYAGERRWQVGATATHGQISQPIGREENGSALEQLTIVSIDHHRPRIFRREVVHIFLSKTCRILLHVRRHGLLRMHSSMTRWVFFPQCGRMCPDTRAIKTTDPWLGWKSDTVQATKKRSQWGYDSHIIW